MASLIKPFSGYIPSAEYAPRIVGPPSSMLTKEEKRASRDDELSFRHVVGRGASPGRVGATNWLRGCLDIGALQPIESAIIVHRLERGSFSATGFIADVSLDAYTAGRVKPHETTIAKTERKMFEYMQSTRIFGNPVALTHRDRSDLAVALSRHSAGAADVAFKAVDGAHHSLWVVTGDDAQALCEGFSDVLYITDGHHRIAAAASLAAEEGRSDAYLPAAVFAEKELTVGAFARAIDDDDVSIDDVQSALRDRFELAEVEELEPRPTAPHQMGVRIAGRSFLLTVPPSAIPDDSYDQLDVKLLQDLVLEPLFGIVNPRTDPRLRFEADTPATNHDADARAAWFLPYPTSPPEVMAVADSGRSMPPKSTFFMPKVPSGLIVRPVD